MYLNPSLIFVKHWYHDDIYILTVFSGSIFCTRASQIQITLLDFKVQGKPTTSHFSLSSNNQLYFLLLYGMLELKSVSDERQPLSHFCDVCSWNKISLTFSFWLDKYPCLYLLLAVQINCFFLSVWHYTESHLNSVCWGVQGCVKQGPCYTAWVCLDCSRPLNNSLLSFYGT